MNSRFASNRSDFASPNMGAARMRRGQQRPRSSGSLALSKLQRAVQRQAGVALLIACAVIALGLAYDRLGEAAQPLWVWLAAGAGAGLAFAFVRELNRNTVSSLSSLGRHRGYAVLGAAPELSARQLRELPPDRRSALGCLTLQPGSAFAAAFRDLQSAIARDRVIAFIASLPEEGATTSALAAAVAAAQQGRRVIIVDCDTRRRTLTHTLECEPDHGVFEAAARPERWAEFVHEEAETGLAFLPAAKLSSPWRSLIGQPGFRMLVDALRQEFDLVILDCPPALGSAEGATLARLADKCVLVVAWDRTPLGALRAGMRALRTRARADTGLYVNRVPAGYRFGRLRPD